VVDSALPKHQQRIRTGSLPRCHLIVYTKVGRYEYEPLRQFDFSYDTTINSVQRSLERMNCSYIDVIQLHDPEFAPSISLLKKETIPALLECRKRGWAKAIGLTGYPLDVQHEILVDCHEEFDGEMIFDQSLVYCHNNLHDMSLYRDACFPPINDQVQRDGTDDSRKNNNNLISFTQFCQQSNIHLMAAAPLSMGLLTIAGPPKWHPASDSLKKACSIAAIVCQSKGIDISTLAVLYSLSQREIGCTLLGMKNVREVDIAADLAMRFCDIDFDQSHSIILDQILLPVEKEALELILDPTHGPFASVAANGKYRWDGQEEAKKFWERLATSNLE
jgi:aryl-alcohol dehydrogenase-like predicted oxidoreductase